MNRLRSFLTPGFRKLYDNLPEPIRRLATGKYRVFRAHPFHLSPAFEAIGKVWTVAIGRSYCAIGRRFGDNIYWVWIGSHEDYQAFEHSFFR